MKNPFTAHPHSVGETYFKHLYYATTSGLKMLSAGLIILLHGIFPFMFKKTGSNLLLELMTKYVQRMPVLDERVISLSDCIELRKKNGTSC